MRERLKGSGDVLEEQLVLNGTLGAVVPGWALLR